MIRFIKEIERNKDEIEIEYTVEINEHGSLVLYLKNREEVGWFPIVIINKHGIIELTTLSEHTANELGIQIDISEHIKRSN